MKMAHIVVTKNQSMAEDRILLDPAVAQEELAKRKEADERRKKQMQ